MPGPVQAVGAALILINVMWVLWVTRQSMGVPMLCEQRHSIGKSRLVRQAHSLPTCAKVLLNESSLVLFD